MGYVMSFSTRPRRSVPFTLQRRRTPATGSRSVSIDGSMGTERVEPLAARELRVATLEVAGADIVGAGVAEDVVRGLCGARHETGGLADDHGQLGLVLDVGAHAPWRATRGALPARRSLDGPFMNTDGASSCSYPIPERWAA